MLTRRRDAVDVTPKPGVLTERVRFEVPAD